MKKILALLLALTMVFALAACGGGNEAPAAEEAAAPAEEAVAPAEEAAPAVEAAAPAEEAAPAEAPAEPDGEASEEPSGDPPAQPIEFSGAVEGIQGELPTEIVMNVELTLADGYSLTVEGGSATNDGNVWTVSGDPGPDTVYVTVVG